MKFRFANLTIFEEGNRNKSPIIFLHGFPFDHSMWDEQINFFKNTHYCISFDIRGLGESAPGNGQYVMETFVDDLFSIIAEVNLTKPILCGLSMGGYISLRSAERDQQKFSALILSDTKSQPDNNEAKLKRGAGIKTINHEGLEKFCRDFIANCFSEKFKNEQSEKYNSIIKGSAKFDPVGVKASLLAMSGRTDTTGFLNQVTIPTLVVCGKEDKLTPPSLMEEMSKQIPRSEFELIENSAHLPPIENPGTFNDILSNFLIKNKL